MLHPIRIEKLIPGGDGFARLPDGRAAFVPEALPGDLVEIAEFEQKKQYVRALDWSLQEASSLRRTPPCPLAQRCGGCNWMALSPEHQRDAKRKLLEEALRRTGGFHEISFPITVSPVGPESAYRQRVRMHFDEWGNIGFFSRRSHRVIDIARCAVASAPLETAIADLRAACTRAPASFVAFSEVEIRATEHCRSLYFLVRETIRVNSERRSFDGGSPTSPRAALDELSRSFSIRIQAPQRSGSRLSTAPPWLQEFSAQRQPERDRLPLPNGVFLLAAPGDFTQVNWDVNGAMVEELLQGAAARGVRTFADLYCGAGNFSLPLLHQGLSGVAVDNDASSIESARAAARAQELDAKSFAAHDVSASIRRWAHEKRRFDLVIADPPRSGLGQAISWLTEIASRHVFLCACDPVTLARDLRTLVCSGFCVKKLTTYDMFPHTHHQEVTAWLERTSSDPSLP